MNNENKSMTFPKEQIWNLYRKLRIGFEEIRKYAFAYINTVRQALQGIFSEILININQVDIRKQGTYLSRLKKFQLHRDLFCVIIST